MVEFEIVEILASHENTLAHNCVQLYLDNLEMFYDECPVDWYYWYLSKDYVKHEYDHPTKEDILEKMCKPEIIELLTP